ncbi:MAG: hypothetical protein IJB69_04160 [Clostridia bacterium]|nr:hypothetical protein [Clostridia bacterium]
MLERFFRYSLQHNKPIRVWLEGEKKYQNITVILMEGETVGFLTARKKTPQMRQKTAFLAASYARGDDGDTLKYQNEGETIG